jgi:hypothetical protein
VLTGPSDRQLGLLAGFHIWRDQFLGVSLAFVVICDGTGGQGKVVLLERGCWFKSGEFVVLLRLRRWEGSDLGPR